MLDTLQVDSPLIMVITFWLSAVGLFWKVAKELEDRLPTAYGSSLSRSLILPTRAASPSLIAHRALVELYGRPYFSLKAIMVSFVTSTLGILVGTAHALSETATAPTVVSRAVNPFLIILQVAPIAVPVGFLFSLKTRWFLQIGARRRINIFVVLAFDVVTTYLIIEATAPVLRLSWSYFAEREAVGDIAAIYSWFVALIATTAAIYATSAIVFIFTTAVTLLRIVVASPSLQPFFDEDKPFLAVAVLMIGLVTVLCSIWVTVIIFGS